MNAASRKPASGFAARLIGQSGHLVYLVQGKDHTGQAAFYYILVDKPKLQSFLAAFDAPQMELTDYGKILASGYGEEPTPEIRQELHERYGFPLEE